LCLFAAIAIAESRMKGAGWTEAEWSARAKGDVRKAQLALLLRKETPMTRAWIAQRLAMGSTSDVSHLTRGISPHDQP